MQKESSVVESNKFINISLNKLLSSNKGIKTSNELLLPKFQNSYDEPDIRKNISLEDSIMREYLKDTFNVWAFIIFLEFALYHLIWQNSNVIYNNHFLNY